MVVAQAQTEEKYFLPQICYYTQPFLLGRRLYSKPLP